MITSLGHSPYASTRCSKKALVLPSSLTKKGSPSGCGDPGAHKSKLPFPCAVKPRKITTKEGYLFAEAKANEWHLEAVPAHVDNVGEVDGKGKAAAWAVRQPAKHTGSSERKAPWTLGRRFSRSCSARAWGACPIGRWTAPKRPVSPRRTGAWIAVVRDYGLSKLN